MEISRRDFLRFSVAAGTGTALRGLIGSGVNLGPVVAQAQELRIKNAKVTPSVCPYCSVGWATLIHTIDGKGRLQRGCGRARVGDRSVVVHPRHGPRNRVFGVYLPAFRREGRLAVRRCGHPYQAASRPRSQ